MANHSTTEHGTSEHISSIASSVTIWLILLVCTGLTVGAAFIDLGPLNTVVALSIATFKATLVVLFFMHVKYTHERLTPLVIVSALFFLGLLLSLSMADFGTRGWH